MQTKILSGKEVSSSVYTSIQSRIDKLKSENIIPGLAVILVGENPASAVYVNSKAKKFDELGLFSETLKMSDSISQDELISKIMQLNEDDRYHGILVQLPLPNHIDDELIINTIAPNKDVDGFHPYNVGCLASGKPKFIPCTPKGIMRILEYYDIDLSGKHTVVIGRSNIVGRPISILTSMKKKYSNSTTTLCHSGTNSIFNHTQTADVIILALGSPQYLTNENVKPGVVVIDVGINRIPDQSTGGYKLVGDADYKTLIGHVGAITPVPGGVGPMTIAMLVENTIEAAEASTNSSL